jgi:hypothetical protein
MLVITESQKNSRRLATKGLGEAIPNTKIHQQARQEEIGGTIRVEGFSGM